MMNAMKRVAATAVLIPPLAILAAMFEAPARADLIGTTVTGSLTFNFGHTNFFDPANGFVPVGFANKTANSPSVAISNSTVEFGFDDGFNTDTADFAGGVFAIGDVSQTAGGAGPFVMTFTDAGFAGLTLTKIIDTFPGTKITGTLVGTTVTLSFEGAGGPFNGNASFTLAPAAVPEPSVVVMAGFVGLGGAGYWLRNRKRAD